MSTFAKVSTPLADHDQSGTAQRQSSEKTACLDRISPQARACQATPWTHAHATSLEPDWAQRRHRRFDDVENLDEWVKSVNPEAETSMKHGSLGCMSTKLLSESFIEQSTHLAERPSEPH